MLVTGLVACTSQATTKYLVLVAVLLSKEYQILCRYPRDWVWIISWSSTPIRRHHILVELSFTHDLVINSFLLLH